MTTEKSYKHFYLLCERVGRLKLLLNANYGLKNIGFGFMNKEQLDATRKAREAAKEQLKNDYSEYKISTKVGKQTIYLN